MNEFNAEDFTLLATFISNTGNQESLEKFLPENVANYQICKMIKAKYNQCWLCFENHIERMQPHIIFHNDLPSNFLLAPKFCC